MYVLSECANHHRKNAEKVSIIDFPYKYIKRLVFHEIISFLRRPLLIFFAKLMKVAARIS